MVGHRLAESGVGGDDIWPEALRERQVETVVDRVVEVEGETHRFRKVLLQRHARDRRLGEFRQSLLGFRLRHFPANRAAQQGVSGFEQP